MDIPNFRKFKKIIFIKILRYGLLPSIILIFALGTNAEATESDSQVEPVPASLYAAMSLLAYPKSEKDSSLVKEERKLACCDVETAGYIIKEFKPSTDKIPPHVLFVNQNVTPIAYVLAFRGTKSFKDWIENIRGGIGFSCELYEMAFELVQNLINEEVIKTKGTLVLTGHSLGGGLAGYVAGRCGINAVTFNSSHLSNPFRPKKGATIDAYYIPFAQIFHGCAYDIIHPLRLGGNYSYTQVHYLKRNPPSSCEQYFFFLNPLNGHSIEFIRKALRENKDRANGIHAPNTATKPTSNPVTAKVSATMRLLESNPNLIAETPTLLRDAMMRNDINKRTAQNDINEGTMEKETLPIIWDGRFRLGAVCDSYPAGGIEEESLRVLDLNLSHQPSDSGADWARKFDMGVSGSYPISNNWAFEGNLRYRELDYDKQDEHDYDVFSFGAGYIYSELKEFESYIYSFAATFRKYEIKDVLAGFLWGGEVAFSQQPSEAFLIWEHVEFGWLTHTGTPGENGYVVNGDAGIRWKWMDAYVKSGQSENDEKSVYLQARAFGGRREADNEVLTNSQWGVGVAVFANLNRWRAYCEPSVRWTHYHLDTYGSDRYSDHQYLIRSEISGPIDILPPLRWLRDWKMILGYSYTLNNAISDSLDYNRNQFSIQISKEY